MADDTTAMPQELADRLVSLTEGLKNEIFDVYICPAAHFLGDDRNTNLLQIAKELYDMCRSYKQPTALVEQSRALQQKQVDDAKMYLFLTRLLQIRSGTTATTTTAYASLVASVRRALVLATTTNNQNANGEGATAKRSLVLELLLDPQAVAQQLNPADPGNNNMGNGMLQQQQQQQYRLLDLPQQRHDEYGNPYVTGGLFDLQDCVQAMRWRENSRPKKRRRVDTNNDVAQLSLAYILVTMVYDSLQAQYEEQLTVHDFMQQVHLLRMFSPVLNNAHLANNAPFWFLFDALLLSSSSNNNNSNIPTDLTLTFVQNELCNIRSSAITVLEKACSSDVVSDYALLARCGEMIMDFRRDDDEALHVRTAIQGKLLRNWRFYLQNLVLKKKQQQSVRVLAATAADASRSPKTTTWRGSSSRGGGGTKRSMQDAVNASNNSSSTSNSRNIHVPALSLREKLALPEYPLFILVKLLLMHRQLDDATGIVVAMERDNVFDYPILYQAYKLLFQFLVHNGHLLFDTRTVVPPVQSLHCTFFPLVGRNGIRILAHLHCGVLELLQERIQALRTPESAAMTPEQGFVRDSCLRALLRMLGQRYTLQEGLKHYEELRRDGGFADVLDGPLSLERAKDICENECQLPASGFPDLMALLEEAPVVDFDQNVASESALPFVAEVQEAVAFPLSVSATAVLLVESEEEDEFYDTHEHPQGEEEDHGYDAAEESQGEPQPEEMAMVDSTLLVQQPRQEETTVLAPPPHRPGDDDDGYVATAEDSQDQRAAKHVNVATRIPRSEIDDGYDATAEESQGPDDVAQPPLTRKRADDYDADDSQEQTEEDEEAQAVTLKRRKPEAISTEAVVKPVAAAASVQEPVASRPDDNIPNQDYGYDAEESQGHSDEEDVPMNVPHAALHQHQQPDNGYDAEESQAGSTTGHQEPAAATDRRHVAFAPVVQPVAAHPEDDPGYLPEEDDVVRTERDGYQGGESSLQHSEEEEEVSETLASTDDEASGTMPSTDDEAPLAALDGQEDGADESPVHKPRHPSAAHSSSDMDAADEQTMDQEEDAAHEDFNHDDDDDDDDDDGSEDMQNFPHSGGAATSRSILHEYAAAAQDEYSPENRHIRADIGREVAPTPGSRASSRDDIIILDDSTSSDETESEESAPPEGSSQPEEPDYDEADEQEVDDAEEEMESSVHSGEEYEHDQGSSTYSSPSPQGKTRAYGEEDQRGAASSTYSIPISERKRPAEDTSLPTRDKEAAAVEAANMENAEMAGGETRDGPSTGVDTVEKSTDVIDIADSPAEDKKMVDGDGDSLGDAGTETVNPKQASAAVNEAGSGPTDDKTMEDFAETVNHGAPKEHEILDETGDGPVADAWSATGDTNKDSIAGEEAGEPPEEPASMHVQPLEETVDAIFANAGAAQEETVGAIIEHAGAVQQSQEVVELLDADSDDAAMDKAEGDAPLEEESDAGTDTDQDSAEESDAGTDADQDSAAELAVDPQEDVANVDVKTGDFSDDVVGEQESNVVDVTEDQPESKLTEDGNVQPDASADGEEEALHAEGEEGGVEGEAGDALVHAAGMRADALAPIPEQEEEVVDDSTADHPIREISTLDRTIVDEDVDHPHDQECQDDDAPAAGSDDESGSRRSRSTRGSVSKVPQTPVRTRQAAKTSPQRTTPQRKKRGEVGDDDIGSIASNTRSAKKKRGDEGGDDGAIASNTRGASAKKNRTNASSEDGGSIASHTRASAKKQRGDEGDDDGAIASNTRGASAKNNRGNASSDDGGSIASHTRASAKKKRGGVGDADGGSSAPNTRARGKQGGATAQATSHVGSNKKPPRPTPWSKKKK